MSIDGKLILYAVWIITTLSLFLFIPKNKVRLALQTILFKQVLTWPLGLFVVEMGWIQYPIRFFPNANQASFTFEYFFYPVVCAYFNVYFPSSKNLLTRVIYYILFCSSLTLAELFILHHTQLISYIHWNAYLTWASLFITFYITRQLCLWFFKPTNSH